MTLNSTFNCICHEGWYGARCKEKVNHCHNITCNQHGVCRSLLKNFNCECFSGSYYGPQCESMWPQAQVHQIASKSFAYIAIVAMTTVVLLIVTIDILKYCFGIDPAFEELDRARRQNQVKRQKHIVARRFIYVSAPSETAK